MPWRCVWGDASTFAFRLAKSVTGLFRRYTPRMGHRPPFDFWRSWCKSVKGLLGRLVMSLVVNVQPPSMCVLEDGDWLLVYMSDGPCFLSHLWMWTPHAISRE
jgi:hypothetical protein